MTDWHERCAVGVLCLHSTKKQRDHRRIIGQHDGTMDEPYQDERLDCVAGLAKHANDWKPGSAALILPSKWHEREKKAR